MSLAGDLVARMAARLDEREHRPRPCRYCGATVTLAMSTVRGHRGFCSARHAALEQEERPW